jgi:hypothetical protein
VHVLTATVNLRRFVYYVFPYTLYPTFNYSTASAYCAEQSWHGTSGWLATITTAEEASAVRDLVWISRVGMGQTAYAYLGAKALNHSWVWVSGPLKEQVAFYSQMVAATQICFAPFRRIQNPGVMAIPPLFGWL